MYARATRAVSPSARPFTAGRGPPSVAPMPLVPPPPPKAPAPALDVPPSAILAGNQPEWSVGELAAKLKQTLEDRFGHVRLRGEISGFRGVHGSGHAYFSLKDGQARIDAVVWKGVYGKLRQKPQEGLEVVATGRITTFAGKSSYQIVIDSLEPAGLGAWMALLEERRKQLAAEGLFLPEHRKPLPFLPGIVGVVTSPTGAVIRDILHRLQDRFPRPVLVWPVRVQGDGAAEEVAAAIRGFNALPAAGPIPRPDLLIVARGGGSIEDLWAFNEECVVRAAFESAIPLISAVGHETDTTLIDHVSDRRAPTPTGAAEMAVPVRADLIATVAELAARGGGAVRRRIERDRADLRGLVRAMPGPDMLLAGKRQRLDLAEIRLAPALAAGANRHRARLQALLDRLVRRSPELALAQARARLERIDDRTGRAVAVDLRRRQDALAQLGRRLVLARDAGLERARVNEARRRDKLAAVTARLAQAARRDGERRRARLDTLAGLLGSLSYLAVLERGFVLVRDGEGRPLRRAGEAGEAARLALQFADGTIEAIPATGDRPARKAPSRSKAKAPQQGTLFEA